MNILVNSSFGIVLSAGSDAIPTDVSDWCTDFAQPAGFDSSYTGVVLPLGYLDNCWSYTGGLWTILTGKETEVAERVMVASPSLVYIDINLPLITITVFYALDAGGVVNRLKVRLDGLGSFSQIPTHLVLMVSVQPELRVIDVTEVSDELQILNVAILASGTTPILAGSTKTKIVTHTVANPIPLETDLSGFYWGAIDNNGYRKATGFDATGFLFADPFDADPTPGNNLKWVEIAWADERAYEYRLMCLINPAGEYEFIRWGKVEERDNQYYVTHLLRAQEGTAQITGANKAYYCPAFGAGTETFLIPATNFSQTGWNTFEGSLDISVSITPGDWVFATACTTTIVGNRSVRSHIVPVTNWSPM
jgi:hypothetical protein